MYLKQTGYCFGVLLLHSITTTITLPSQAPPGLAPRSDGRSVLTAGGLSHPSDRGASEESRDLPYFHDVPDGDHTETRKTTMASTDDGFKARNDPTDEGCSKGSIEHVVPGKFYMTGRLETNPNAGYQADSAASVLAQGAPERVRGRWLGGSEESWQRLQPVVTCGDDAMTLTVRRRRAVQLQLDQVNKSSVPLSQLPPQCGYSVETTWRDLRLMAQYDACHVTQEDDGYVLPLLWRGTPVKMFCPASQIQPQAAGPSSLCCSDYGMTVTVQGLHATEELRVNVRGEWTPLLVLAEQCDYTLHRQDAGIVIAAPFITCGITVKVNFRKVAIHDQDGEYTLSLQIGEKTFTLACPVPAEELPLTHQPLVHIPHHLSRGPAEHVSESLDPFLWAPPFYLAPPYYPHPIYRHYPGPDGQDAYNPPTPSSSTPDPTFGPKPLPALDSQTDYQDLYPHQTSLGEAYKHFGVDSSPSSTDEMKDSGQVDPDLQQKQETPVLGVLEGHGAAHSPSSDAGFLIPVEPPPLQPPNHAFNPYYHYYHLPKIPLPGPPQDPDPGPEVPRERSLTNPHNPDYTVLPPNMQQSETLSRVKSHQFLSPGSEAASHPHTPPKTPAPATPHPPHPPPYHYYYYFPHIVRGEVKRLAPLNPLSDQNPKSHTVVHPLPRSSQVDEELNPHMDQPSSKEMIVQINSPDVIKHPLLSDGNEDVEAELDDVKRPSAPVTPAVHPLLPSHPPGPHAVAAPPLEQSFPPPSANHYPPPYPYYYHPLYYYYQMYYKPESLPTSSEEALDPPRHQSYGKPQTTAPPTKPMYDIHNGPLDPSYYYYHLYYHPKESVHNQELQPAGSITSERASSKSKPLLPSDSDYSGTARPAHAEAGYPQQLRSPFHSLNNPYVSQQHPYDPVRHPSGEETGERLDDELKDNLEADQSAASASPRGVGPVSDIDCPGNECTMGQHLIFAMPDPADPSVFRAVSCKLQKLTSDPDIFAIPLDGCGVHEHREILAHLHKVHGVYSPQQDHSSELENSPVRLMDCRSLPGSPDEVRLHVMDQPPPPPVQSTPAAVDAILRIATDESFTSFHPEVHLPLSLMRGRPVYVELSLLDPPEPDLVLLVHSCLAYTRAPYPSWMLAYDGCLSLAGSQLLPSPHSDSHHIRRIVITGFLSMPTESPTYRAKGYSHLDDPEIYFLCLTEVCSATDGDCTLSCINGPNGDT